MKPAPKMKLQEVLVGVRLDASGMEMCCCMGPISSCYILPACRFRRDFADVGWVSSPIVHWGLSTSKVLTLEYLPGIKISDVTALRAAGIDTKLVAQRATEAYLIQLLQTSFLHSDPHPGNIGVDSTGD
jgi:predicted unusual protein kinase regulating ubiquinone biosynthesis (AarF/ABC1/UbiB family)